MPNQTATTIRQKAEKHEAMTKYRTIGVAKALSCKRNRSDENWQQNRQRDDKQINETVGQLLFG